ncbi:NAD(P)/FAD-dependent oxidoreductase [Arthrobacter sp. W4I7]|uniref:NAD(P)/FAD-dependent oxidoreductase n=1 Tax=Arthrobacter sp. W4I7 TaxID=3042296 RepID=UPI00277FCA37|nr:FAD-dependent oxidoreductase [Arthrobacter sp. W4I7]MDQ0691439.1 3-phenylpropionate/trans-cinnamate dioxygenase ferredoxin reductase subunit [Arthrobacter sp. W4I7]
MSENDHGVLIIGASQAGVQIASSLRDLGYHRPITLVGAEEHAPYQRPPLSKAFLKGEAGHADLALRAGEFYRDRSINLVMGERITSISPGAGVAVAASGRQFHFSRLALTTGAAPTRFAGEGGHLEGVMYVRDANDATELKNRLGDARNVVVIGGGFIGLEVAASAKKLGKEVTVLLRGSSPMSRSVGPLVSSFFRDSHIRRGVRFITRAQVSTILDNGAGKVQGVQLASGHTVPADIVIVGIGAEPRVELAREMGLAVDNGILVDRACLASDGWTVAAGDCTSVINPLATGHGPERLRFESVNNAIEQAKIAAATLAGQRAEYQAAPWCWSDQFDLKLQSVGLSAGHDRHVLRGSVDAEKFSVLYYLGGQLIAADCVNTPVDFMAIRSALLAGRSIPAPLAADTSVPLKRLTTDIHKPVLAS